MAAFLAIISAALFGAGDFFGGLASRRTGIFSVIAIAHLIGLFVILLVAPFMADQFLLDDFFRGALAGILGLIGIALIFHALQRGPMTIVAPITSIASAVIPVTLIFFGLLYIIVGSLNTFISFMQFTRFNYY